MIKDLELIDDSTTTLVIAIARITINPPANANRGIVSVEKETIELLSWSYQLALGSNMSIYELNTIQVAVDADGGLGHSLELLPSGVSTQC